jgi:hypothetical protein
MVIPGSNVSVAIFTGIRESRRPRMADNEGTMVIRAWVEPAQNHSIRARLISSQPGSNQEIVEAAGTADEILKAVRRWLDALQPATDQHVDHPST